MTTYDRETRCSRSVKKRSSPLSRARVVQETIAYEMSYRRLYLTASAAILLGLPIVAAFFS